MKQLIHWGYDLTSMIDIIQPIQPHICLYVIYTFISWNHVFFISLHHDDVRLRTSLVLLVPYALRPWRCAVPSSFLGSRILRRLTWFFAFFLRCTSNTIREICRMFLKTAPSLWLWWNYSISSTCNKPLLLISTSNIKLSCLKMRRGADGFVIVVLWRT